MSDDVKIITTPIEYIEAGERLMAERQADRIESMVSGAEYAKLEAELAELQKSCVWTAEESFDELVYTTTCGDEYGTFDGEPMSDLYKFCPNCGHPILPKHLPSRRNPND